MAEIKALHAIILILFLISLFHIPKASSKPSGFSLKLIRAYPPMSSISHKNNTFRERYKSYVQASMARASYYWTSFHKSTANKTFQPDVIMPPLRIEGERIVVQISIGTPGQQVFLEFDTGSLNSWTQCASCTTCFPQSTAMFDPRNSSTYREMFSNDNNCNFDIYYRNNQKCEYRAGYIDGQHSHGIVSYETFADNNPFSDVFSNIRFGCSLEAAGFKYRPNTIISGILGMSRAKESLPSQLSQIRRNYGTFSYCLVDINTAPSAINKVTFGDDIPNIRREYLSRVSFITHPYSHHLWAINLVDISVGEERLYLPPGTFAPFPNRGNGGLILDTGAPFTYITRSVYLVIKSKIQDYLLRSVDFTQVHGKGDLCYSYNGTFGQILTYLQTITFHLENQVDLVIPVTSAYFFNRENNSFCLGIMGARGTHWPNILGSRAQQNKRFIYDNVQNSLFFMPEQCDANQA